MSKTNIAPFTGRRPAPKPPSTLAGPGRKLWRALQNEYGITDQGGRTLLESACRAESDIVRLRELVERDGDTLTDRFGQTKLHPALSAIRDCESTKRQAIKALCLDVEPSKPTKPKR